MSSTANVIAAKDRLAVALDFTDEDQAMKLVDSLGDSCRWFKVGMELYYAAGNHVVRQLRDAQNMLLWSGDGRLVDGTPDQTVQILAAADVGGTRDHRGAVSTQFGGDPVQPVGAARTEH